MHILQKWKKRTESKFCLFIICELAICFKFKLIPSVHLIKILIIIQDLTFICSLITPCKNVENKEQKAYQDFQLIYTVYDKWWPYEQRFTSFLWQLYCSFRDFPRIHLITTIHCIHWLSFLLFLPSTVIFFNPSCIHIKYLSFFLLILVSREQLAFIWSRTDWLFLLQALVLFLMISRSINPRCMFFSLSQCRVFTTISLLIKRLCFNYSDLCCDWNVLILYDFF